MEYGKYIDIFGMYSPESIRACHMSAQRTKRSMRPRKYHGDVIGFYVSVFECNECSKRMSSNQVVHHFCPGLFELFWNVHDDVVPLRWGFINYLDTGLHPQGVRRGCKGLKPQQHT